MTENNVKEMTVRYTMRLLQNGKKRRRLTNDLLEICNLLADDIVEVVESGTEVMVEGRRVAVRRYESLLSQVDYLEIDNEEGIPGVIARKPSGTSFFLDEDEDTEVKVADRDTFLWFINNIFDVIRSFEIEQEQAIENLRRALYRFRKKVEEI